MKIALVSAEAVPFSKTGGLADVAGTLFKEYLAMNHDALLFVPFYKSTHEKFSGVVQDSGIELDIPIGAASKTCKVYTGHTGGTGPNIYFIGNEQYFFRDELYGTSFGDYPDNDQRFAFFSRSVLEICKRLDLSLDIMHCHDWQTALIPLYMKTLYSNVRAFKKTVSVMTIHNLGYQGLFPAQTLEVTGLDASLFNPEGIEFYGKTNFLKAGIVGADLITTVSKTYSEEIRTPEFGFGLDGVLRKRGSCIFGIMNGIDYSEWDPATDTFLVRNYDKSSLPGKQACRKHLIEKAALHSSAGPLMCFIGRLSYQKGVDLLAEAMPHLLAEGARIVVIGRGEARYLSMLEEVKKRSNNSLFLHTEFDEPFAHLAYAGSDIFLMPSRYEPCGLGQMIAMRYGTIPVARRTGGITDTVEDDKTGFLFEEYSLSSLMEAVKRALKAFNNKKAWRKTIGNAMNTDFSWKKSAQEYIEIYKNTIKQNALK